MKQSETICGLLGAFVGVAFGRYFLGTSGVIAAFLEGTIGAGVAFALYLGVKNYF